MMWQFNHIYIEKDIKDHPRTADILEKCRANGIFYIWISSAEKNRISISR